VDITFCKVWDLESDFFDAFFTLFVIVLPLFFGPVLTALLEAYQAIRRLRTKSPPVERSNRRRHLCLVYVLASISIGTYLANLYLVEGVIFSLYHLNGFELLMLKYVLGYSDLIFVPLLIIVMDPDVRGGVCEVCRNKRAAREPAESSIF